MKAENIYRDEANKKEYFFKRRTINLLAYPVLHFEPWHSLKMIDIASY